jgi:hypothetical protein
VSSCLITLGTDLPLSVKRIHRTGDPNGCLRHDGVSFCGPMGTLEDPSRSPGAVREFVVGNARFGHRRADCCDGPPSVKTTSMG